jgi:hypothetical protein
VDVIYQRKECRQADLPSELCFSRRRLAVSNSYPGLAARVFSRLVRQVYHDIIMGKPWKDTRISRDFRLRPVRAFGTVAAHLAVIEPQVDGRLHIHMSLYGSKINPELLTRVACSPVLSNQIARWIESV